MLIRGLAGSHFIYNTTALLWLIIIQMDTFPGFGGVCCWKSIPESIV